MGQTFWTAVGAIAACCSTLLTIALVIYAARTISRQATASIRANEHTRAQVTMTFTLEWQRVVVQQYDEILDYVKTQGWTLDHALRTHAFDEEVRKRVRPMLENMEHLGLGVRMRAYSGDIVYHLANGFLKETHQTFRYYIASVRQGSAAAGRLAHPTAFEHFDWLIMALADRERTPQPPLPGTLED
ncbi:DUF4760 domain-containing protein [Motilibacter aurantiacus]|uniref:DUF4760 domain-containing protein n=1 Tax=Motilibacter aurantiacus TaxID=2714955 RepID=UPI0014096F1B|nr:hypothetical protein [Motilibacter aurantiacus]NHC44628.1 hypothetical protein [Motilibacter aurantiacus]